MSTTRWVLGVGIVLGMAYGAVLSFAAAGGYAFLSAQLNSLILVVFVLWVLLAGVAAMLEQQRKRIVEALRQPASMDPNVLDLGARVARKLRGGDPA